MDLAAFASLPHLRDQINDVRSRSRVFRRVQGKNYILTAIDDGIVIEQNSAGSAPGFLSYGSLWNQLTGGAPLCHLADPYLAYDKTDDRWLLTMVADPGLGTSTIIVAASENANPMDHWQAYQFRPDPGRSLWAASPIVSLSEDTIALNAELHPVQDASTCAVPLEAPGIELLDPHSFDRARLRKTSGSANRVTLPPSTSETYYFSKADFYAGNVSPVGPDAPRPRHYAASPVSVSPNAGLGSAQTFTFNFFETLGGNAITQAYILFNSVLYGSMACYMQYSSNNTISLLHDAGNA